MKFPQKFVKSAVLPFIIIVIAAGAGYGGYYLGNSTVTTVERETPLDADFSLFWDAVEVIKKNYVDIDEVSDEKLLYGAIKGALRSLNDPYSVFFEPSDAQKFEEDIRGSFGGIGAEIGIRNNQLIIVAPLKGNPAEAAGLKAGDKILQIDNEGTTDMTVEEAVKLIRGEERTEIRLLIIREGWDEAREFKITRAIIIVPTLEWGVKDDILLVQLQNFNANVPSLIYEAVLGGFLQNAKGMILDLRNNPGGYLDVAVNIAGWFLDRGAVVVKERFADGAVREFRARGNAALRNFPVVIIINEGSASASEILAGALRDQRGIKLVGAKTFGKGTVQELETLKDGSVVKISIAEWLTPAGHTLNKKGITPDFEIKMDGENAKRPEDVENKRDPQLEKAIEILKLELK
jgi:carboxyl-terminal processing protease